MQHVFFETSGYIKCEFNVNQQLWAALTFMHPADASIQSDLHFFNQLSIVHGQFPLEQLGLMAQKWQFKLTTFQATSMQIRVLNRNAPTAQTYPLPISAMISIHQAEA